VPRRPGREPSPAYADLPIPTPLLDRDVSPGLAERMLRTGAWERLRWGACVARDELSDDPHLRERQLAAARTVAVVRQADVVRHHRPTDDDRTVRHGVAVTSLARTVVDCACHLGPRGGIVVADAAPAAGLDRGACLDLLGRMRGARGVRTARALLAVADDGAESPGESLTRLALLAAGLPAPTTQVPVTTHLGTFWLDLGWPEVRVGVEFDGAVKYEADVATVLAQEKRRQEAVEEAGWALCGSWPRTCATRTPSSRGSTAPWRAGPGSTSSPAPASRADRARVTPA